MNERLQVDPSEATGTLPSVPNTLNVESSENRVHSIPVPLTEGRSDNEGCTTSNDEFETSEPEEPIVLGTSSKPASETDPESVGFAGSTVADA